MKSVFETAHYYLIFFIWRHGRASPKNAWSQFRVKTLLFCLEGYWLIGIVLALFHSYLRGINDIFLAAAIGLPVFLLQERVYANRDKWRFYWDKFSSFPTWKRVSADAITATFCGMSIISLFALRAQLTGLHWWQ